MFYGKHINKQKFKFIGYFIFRLLFIFMSISAISASLKQQTKVKTKLGK